MIDVEDIEVRLKLLSGSPFEVEGFGEIHPLTIRDIVKVGFLNYQKYLRVLTVKIEEFGYVNNDQDIDPFDLFVSKVDKGLTQEFEKALQFFFKKNKVHINENLSLVFIGDSDKPEDSLMIDRSIFIQIREILELQNCLKGHENFKPKGDKAQSIIDKLKKSKEIVNRSRKDDNADIDLVDIISAVSSMSNGINKLNVWDLNLYQFYDEYKRLNVIEQYSTSIQSLLHGADSNKIQIKHWSSKIRD